APGTPEPSSTIRAMLLPCDCLSSARGEGLGGLAIPARCLGGNRGLGVEDLDALELGVAIGDRSGDRVARLNGIRWIGRQSGVPESRDAQLPRRLSLLLRRDRSLGEI